ncbi:reverse transcriptase domain-containing protein [Nephila pilipes]|uniref:Reverse transcriptase domain-containing protein n=1 Tax=Nephila pilipes TaxID=299642 RepID=A0A8X6NB81_NEPPI|nr:reverse transcriptase domain-containing protein [Nephila pilipes]
MYLAGIEEVPSSGIRIRMLADDIVLWSSDTAIPDLESKLNDFLTALSNYAADLKLHFNPSKSIATFFTTNKHLYNYQPKLRLNNQDLTYEKHPKYLWFVSDPEFTSNKHIDYLVLKSRKRLNILKYIADKNWGADAATLRLTYLTLIRSILEYGFPIYCCASKSVLKKLERVQLSAARIITGLKHSCPSNIVLFEAEVQPLLFRRQTGFVKYFNKLSSFGQQNQTSKYLNNWVNGQKLKKKSPFSQVESENFLTEEVEPSSLQCSLNPSGGGTLQGVFPLQLKFTRH